MSWWGKSSWSWIFANDSSNANFILLGGALGLGCSCYYYVRWSQWVRKKIQLLQESFIFGGRSQQSLTDPFRMVRMSNTETTSNDDSNNSGTFSSTASQAKIRLLDLDSSFFVVQCRNEKEQWNVMSLGDYISSLRPFSILPTMSTSRKSIHPSAPSNATTTTTNASNNNNTFWSSWIEREMQAALIGALLKGLGPYLGAAVLPGLGVSWVQATVHTWATRVASHLPSASSSSPSPTSPPSFSSPALSSSSLMHSYNDDQDDRGGVPLSLFAMTYVAEFNYQRLQKQKRQRDDANIQEAASLRTVDTPLRKLQLGEVGYSPSFNSALVPPSVLDSLPDPPPPPVAPPMADAAYSPVSHSARVASTTLSDPVLLVTPLMPPPIATLVPSVAADQAQPMYVVPNPFVVSEHWKVAIESMEVLILAQEKSSQNVVTTQGGADRGNCDDKSCTEAGTQKLFYSPHSTALPEPTPIDQRWLPDLYLGWGGPTAQCTHTHRQILQNRLISVLLNRLASNYAPSAYENEADGDSGNQWMPFILKMDSSSVDITKPSDFIGELMKIGHSVETCIRMQPTAFCVALSVREKDDTWKYIPLAYFLQNGYADANGKEAFVCLPHSGLNLEIGPGPLFEKGVSVQHFMAIDGLCGWHSNQQVANVPWTYTVECGQVMVKEMALESVRVAGLEAVIINTVGTNHDLPFGGYGLTGVCNDSAALIEFALTGETHIYPLTFNGKFAMQNLRVARNLRRMVSQTTEGVSRFEARFNDMDLASLDRLIGSIMSLPSDTNTLPSEAKDQCRRQLHCMPKNPPFSLMIQSKSVIQSIQCELEGN